jgi:DUF4097 and DUF4098 domain-containing protein YvlB
MLAHPLRSLASAASVAFLAGGLLVTAMTLPGCVIGGDYDDSSLARHNVTLTQPSAATGKLSAEARNGSLIVHKAKDGQLRVDAIIKSKSEGRAKDATVQIQDVGGGVEVTIAWPDKQWREGDGASLEIWIPNASGLALTTSNGDIEAAGFSGKATIRTSNSMIRINDHAGDLIAKTSNGDIVASRITGNADATTSNSDVTLRDVSGTVTAASSNGDVTVSLVSGAAGPVKATTSNGDITLLVSPAFAGSVRASTSNGNVECLASRASRSGNSSTSATFQFGAGSTSVLETSNGNITVKPQ